MPRKDPGPLTLDDLEGRSFATVPEYAAIMRLDPRTVYAAIRAGDIPATKVGSKSFIPMAWIRQAASAGSAT
jgi:excisionase family DNA binding protein